MCCARLHSAPYSTTRHRDCCGAGAAARLPGYRLPGLTGEAVCAEYKLVQGVTEADRLAEVGGQRAGVPAIPRVDVQLALAGVRVDDQAGGDGGPDLCSQLVTVVSGGSGLGNHLDDQLDVRRQESRSNSLSKVSSLGPVIGILSAGSTVTMALRPAVPDGTAG